MDGLRRGNRWTAAATVLIFATACTSSTEPTSSTSTTPPTSATTSSSTPSTSTSTTTTTIPPAPTLTEYLIGVIEAAGEADVAGATTALAVGTEQAYRDAVAAIAEQRRRMAALDPPPEAVEMHEASLELASAQIELLTSMAEAIAARDLVALEELSQEAIGLAGAELDVATAHAEQIGIALEDIDTPTSDYLQEAVISAQRMRSDLATVFADLQAILLGEFPGLEALTAILENETAVLDAASRAWDELMPTAAAVPYHAAQGSLIDGGAAQVRAMLDAVAADDPLAFGDALRASTANFQRAGDVNGRQSELLLDVFRGTTRESDQALTLTGLPRALPVDAIGGLDGQLVGVGFGTVGTSTHGLFWAEPIKLQIERRDEVATLETITRRSVVGVVGEEFVLLGSVRHVEGGDEFAAWRSKNGHDWEDVDLGPDATRVELGAHLVDAASSALGLVAVGCDCDLSASRPVIWFTRDGSVWQRVDFETGPPSRAFRAVAAGESGFVAVDGEDVWVSSDGLAWDRVDSAFSPEAEINSVTRRGSGFVAGGIVGTGSDRRGAVWASADGRSWQARDGGVIGAPGTAVAWIAEYDGGLVAVGSDASESKLIPAAWVSPDGTNWDRIELALDPPLERGAQRFARVYEGGPGLIVTGFDDERPMLWVGYPTG